jgi:magnesium-transporting ATPase (P-type)
MVFMSSLVVNGNCYALVDSTGLLTEFGKAFQEMKDEEVTIESSVSPLIEPCCCWSREI